MKKIFLILVFFSFYNFLNAKELIIVVDTVHYENNFGNNIYAMFIDENGLYHSFAKQDNYPEYFKILYRLESKSHELIVLSNYDSLTGNSLLFFVDIKKMKVYKTDSFQEYEIPIIETINLTQLSIECISYDPPKCGEKTLKHIKEMCDIETIKGIMKLPR